jgi:Cu(I)/Ag(I) efflux system membrane fusion protein
MCDGMRKVIDMRSARIIVVNIAVLLSVVWLIPHVVFAEEGPVTYTCSMHPQIRLPGPGQCPICGMPLIPAEPSRGTNESHAAVVRLSDAERRIASVETVAIGRRLLAHVERAVGKALYNETALATITARVQGYAERLYVNFTGVEVSKGDHLVDIYSPELVVAQQELLVAAKVGRGTPIFESARLKLSRWGLSEPQIEEIVRRGKVNERVTLHSPISGTVIARNITEKAAFSAGDVLYQIANLDTVWAYLDVYESQLPMIRYGQHVTIKTESHPGRTFEGQVTFISPVVDEQTRTVKVPVNVSNSDHALKPGMFVSADIHVTLGADGSPAPTGAEGKYSCPMHPQVIESKPGACPLCGMDLQKIPGDKARGHLDPIAVPVGAVLHLGKRDMVYVEKEPGVYTGRLVVLGPRAGEYYAVLKGLAEGEKVAVRGAFMIDSQAQISGQSSLFQPEAAVSMQPQGHQH